MKNARKKVISMLMAFILAVTLIPMGAALGSDELLEGDASLDTVAHDTEAAEGSAAVGITELEPGLTEWELGAEVPAQAEPAPPSGLGAQEPAALIEDADAGLSPGQEDASVDLLASGVGTPITLLQYQYMGASGWITPSSWQQDNLTRGEVGKGYTSTRFFVNNDATQPIRYSLEGSSLPPGLKLSADGALSGIPTKGGYYSVAIKASNSAGSIVRTFKIAVADTPVITTSSLPTATVGSAYEQKIEGTTEYSSYLTWKFVSGNLPPGLTFFPNTVNRFWADVRGTPTQAGTFTFTVSASNTHAVTQKTFSIKVVTPSAPSITTSSLLDGMVGDSYKKTLAASGTNPMSWTRISGSLPPGLTLSGAGVLSGKPTKAGTYTFTVRAANHIGTHSKTFKITVRQKPKITTTIDSVHAGITGINYKKTLAASGTGTITWSRTSGSLPPGLKLSSAGVISGKPTKPGTYTFKVRATNSLGNTTKSFTIKVNNPSISISYQTHVQSVGWQAFKKDGAMSGTSGKALRLEGIKINLKNNTGISGGIRYSTHVQ
ncbi:MAG: putative Ig domain-containing protein, partial [Coriobacteriia bacterium]|nr:putative Ig domain-containing protein [Coriobacteriia bacterium]